MKKRRKSSCPKQKFDKVQDRWGKCSGSHVASLITYKLMNPPKTIHQDLFKSSDVTSHLKI